MNNLTNNQKPKILFTTPVLAHPPVGGPELRIENSIKALSQVSDFHIISRLNIDQIGGKAAEDFFKNICYNFGYTPYSYHEIKKVASPSNLLNKIINKVLYVLNKVHRLYIINDIDFMKTYIDRNNIDIVWFGYGNISYDLMKTLKQIRSQIKMVCDTDSVWSRFVSRGIPFEKDPVKKQKLLLEVKKKEDEERNWVDFMDVTTAVSDIDAEYYRSLTNRPEKVKRFSNVIDTETYKNVPDKTDNFKKPCIYLAGSFFKNSPMEQAARWFINLVFSIIHKEIPNIHLYIIGRNSDKYLSDIKESNIIITGEVESVLPYLCNSDVAIVPLMFESGTRFKILEAAACNIPIVSTTLGAEGLDVTNNENILFADDPNSFAEAIIKVLNEKNIAKRIAKNCNELVKQKYSINSLVEEGKAIIHYLMYR